MKTDEKMQIIEKAMKTETRSSHHAAAQSHEPMRRVRSLSIWSGCNLGRMPSWHSTMSVTSCSKYCAAANARHGDAHRAWDGEIEASGQLMQHQL